MENKQMIRSLFIESLTGNIKDKYYFEKKLGSGGYGAVYLAKNRRTGEKVAVKAMQKSRITDHESFQNEISILRSLDHPNIIKLYETWETDRICFLVTEVCEGGELFYHITQKKHLTEQQTSTIMKQAFQALQYLHNNRICHRDIKPENFLLYKPDDDSHIKLIDFGLAKRVNPNEIMNKPNGTPYYIAPEVLKGSYTTQCDVWSMGVIMFIMLSGKPPFGGKTNKDIINNVLNGTYNMKSEVWNNVSNDAKDLIQQILVRSADERLTSQEAFEHPWIQKEVQKENSMITLDPTIISNMENYINQSKLRQGCLLYIASRIPESQIQDLRAAFTKFDKNGDGQLTHEELIEGVKQVPNIKLSIADLEKAIQVMDSNNNGLIDYTEFIAACMYSQNYTQEKKIRQAFEYFDRDGSGAISAEELKECLHSDDFTLTDDQINDLIKEVDQNEDGQIDYHEFLDMMMSKNTSNQMNFIK